MKDDSGDDQNQQQAEEKQQKEGSAGTSPHTTLVSAASMQGVEATSSVV